MKSLEQMISEASSRYKPEDGFKPPVVFKEEKVIVSVDQEYGYPNMNTVLQARLKAEGYRAFNLEGEELSLFTPAKLEYNEH